MSPDMQEPPQGSEEAEAFHLRELWNVLEKPATTSRVSPVSEFLPGHKLALSVPALALSSTRLVEAAAHHRLPSHLIYCPDLVSRDYHNLKAAFEREPLHNSPLLKSSVEDIKKYGDGPPSLFDLTLPGLCRPSGTAMFRCSQWLNFAPRLVDALGGLKGTSDGLCMTSARRNGFLEVQARPNSYPDPAETHSLLLVRSLDKKQAGPMVHLDAVTELAQNHEILEYLPRAWSGDIPNQGGCSFVYHRENIMKSMVKDGFVKSGQSVEDLARAQFLLELSQLALAMTHKQCPYGMLTSYDHTVFVRVVNRDNTSMLAVSPVHHVRSTEPPIFGTITALLFQAAVKLARPDSDLASLSSLSSESSLSARPSLSAASPAPTVTRLQSAAVHLQQQMAGLPSEFSKSRKIRVIYDFVGSPTAPDHLDLDDTRQDSTFTPILQNRCFCEDVREETETDAHISCGCKLPPLFIAFESVLAYGSEATVFKIHGSSVLAKVCGPYEGDPKLVKNRRPGDWESDFETESLTYEGFPKRLFGAVVPRYFGSYRFGRGQALILIEACGSSIERLGGFDSLPSLRDKCAVYDLFEELVSEDYVTNGFRPRNVVRNDKGEYRLIDFGNMRDCSYAEERLEKARYDLMISIEDWEAFKRGEL